MASNGPSFLDRTRFGFFLVMLVSAGTIPPPHGPGSHFYSWLLRGVMAIVGIVGLGMSASTIFGGGRGSRRKRADANPHKLAFFRPSRLRCSNKLARDGRAATMPNCVRYRASLAAEPMASTFKSLPWYGKVGLVAFWIFVVPPLCILLALIFAPVVMLAVLLGGAGEAMLWFRIARVGRCLPPWQVRKRIAAEGGTLIVESPTLGWGTTRAWWTADNVLALSPHPQPTPEEYKSRLQTAHEPACFDWDRWCFANYTCPERGRAMLIPALTQQIARGEAEEAISAVGGRSHLDGAGPSAQKRAPSQQPDETPKRPLGCSGAP